MNIKQTDIKISLTEFVNFINASGMAKITIVSSAKSRHEEQEGSPYDYWKDFKDTIILLLKQQGSKEELWGLVDDVREEMRANYNQMITGYLRFWRPKRMSWIAPIKKTIHMGGIKMILNPELGLKWQGKEYMVKLYLKANENLDKRHADIILAMMESELRDKVGDGVVFAILDVRRGKLFTYVNEDPRLLILLKSEGREFAEIWKEL